MGCLLGGLSALLAFAIPASIARASLVGAYVVIVVLAALAVAGVTARRRRRPSDTPRAGRAVPTIVVVSLLYAGVVTVVHATG